MSHTSFAIAARELNLPRPAVWSCDNATGAYVNEIDSNATEMEGS